MKRLLTTTALVLTLTTGVIATAAESAITEYKFQQTSDHLVSDLIGMRIYAAEPEDSATSSTDWDDIGEINDLVVTKDGEVAAVILGIGGFLGIGEKDIAVTMNDIAMTTDDNGDQFLVVKTTRKALEDAPAFTAAYEQVSASDATSTEAASAVAAGPEADSADANADRVAAFDADRPRLERPEIVREGYETIAYDGLTADQIEGATVYGTNDENVGEVKHLITSTDGKMQHAVIDVGGFLGLGEKPVLVSFDELQIVKEADGDDVRIYIASSEEALKNQPEFSL